MVQNHEVRARQRILPVNARLRIAGSEVRASSPANRHDEKVTLMVVATHVTSTDERSS